MVLFNVSGGHETELHRTVPGYFLYSSGPGTGGPGTEIGLPGEIAVVKSAKCTRLSLVIMNIWAS